MTTLNVVPIIPSAALGTESLLAAHVTLTPLGAPGLNASVPGAHPDARVEETRCGNMTKDSEETLLESAKAYFPAQADVTRALSNFKAYLPEGFVAYLPGSTVDLGHATSVPSPEPSASADVPIPAGDESMTVHTGYSTDAIPPSTSGPHLPLVPSPSAPTPKASTT
ncbi:hypothetical protein B0H13DRAFT_2095633 [Mycena leptocephala]|nr:hypothetical protein B0H13DRAFT_2095633 [Mycena leptocephala]